MIALDFVQASPQTHTRRARCECLVKHHPMREPARHLSMYCILTTLCHAFFTRLSDVNFITALLETSCSTLSLSGSLRRGRDEDSSLVD